MNKVLLSNRGMGSSVIMSSITINSLTRQPKICSSVTLSSFTLSSQSTRSLVHSFTKYVPLLLCLPLQSTRSLVHSFTKYVPLLLCLPLQSTRSLVPLSTRSLNMFLCYFVFPYPVFVSKPFTCQIKKVPRPFDLGTV